MNITGYATLAGNLSSNAAKDPVPGTVNSVARFLTLLILFVIVLAITYFTTRFMAKAQSGAVKARNMEVMETLQLAPGRYLQIVRVGEEYFLIGTGKDTVSFCTELKGDYEFSDKELPGFSDILEKFKKKNEEE